MQPYTKTHKHLQTEKQTKTHDFILQNATFIHELLDGFVNFKTETKGGNFTILFGFFAQLIFLPIFSSILNHAVEYEILSHSQ